MSMSADGLGLPGAGAQSTDTGSNGTGTPRQPGMQGTASGSSTPRTGSPSTLKMEDHKEPDPDILVLATDDNRKIKKKMAKQLKGLNKAVDGLVDVQASVSSCVRGMATELQKFDNAVEAISGMWEKKGKAVGDEDNLFQIALEELRNQIEACQEGVELIFEEVRGGQQAQEIDLATQAMDIMNEAGGSDYVDDSGDVTPTSEGGGSFSDSSEEYSPKRAPSWTPGVEEMAKKRKSVDQNSDRRKSDGTQIRRKSESTSGSRSARQSVVFAAGSDDLLPAHNDKSLRKQGSLLVPGAEEKSRGQGGGRKLSSSRENSSGRKSGSRRASFSVEEEEAPGSERHRASTSRRDSAAGSRRTSAAASKGRHSIVT